MKTLPLSQGLHAIVDDEDYSRVSCYKWSAVKRKEACGTPVYIAVRTTGSRGHQKSISLHRFILSAPVGYDVDHKDRTRCLDCRRSNLRLATRSQNLANARKRLGGTSKYKGVTKKPTGKPWMSRIAKEGEQIYLGRFDTEEAAARAYNSAAVELFGEFALLNDIQIKD